MKQRIDLNNWNRKEAFAFFSTFDEPFFGLTISIDCTIAYANAKEKGQSFFLYYLYRALQAANLVENFRYRIIGEEVYLFDEIHASPTINRPNGTFGFAYMNYFVDEANFIQCAQEEIKKTQESTALLPAITGENVIHFSAIPWLDFTSLSHARNYSFADSCPKISFGKVTEHSGVQRMPVSIHAHHALVDGYHVGLFVAEFQRLMNEK
ncbi:chloramphenicol acetyltransferase [Myroides sp. NP-2]|uniref:chloramphenicol acetyltransferase n=1 Tax=Myroides sp. NP-2 TaxID=2759945 RepID=UPI0015FCAB67|nr:chloramphenicol acetyltransferase [Myroides sp. NP-2]MBB1151158.1 chloramphenicol acetyltransferase [Myroides sp. NP-2]